jgi:hypothetical protein
MRRAVGWVLFLVSSRSAVKLIVQVFLFLNKALRFIRKKRRVLFYFEMRGCFYYKEVVHVVRLDSHCAGKS